MRVAKGGWYPVLRKSGGRVGSIPPLGFWRGGWGTPYCLNLSGAIVQILGNVEKDLDRTRNIRQCDSK